MVASLLMVMVAVSTLAVTHLLLESPSWATRLVTVRCAVVIPSD